MFRQGDILMMRGESHLSQVLRILDDCEFDHCAVVLDDLPDPRIADMVFLGSGTERLSAYPGRVGESVSALLISEHRLPGWRVDVASCAEGLAGAGGHYATDRLVYLAFIGLNRWGKLTLLQRKMLMHWLSIICNKLPSPLGTEMICADLVYEACDVEDSTSSHTTLGANIPLYYGLTIEKRDRGYPLKRT